MKRKHWISFVLTVALIAAGPSWADDTPKQPAEEKAGQGGYEQGGDEQGGYQQGGYQQGGYQQGGYQQGGYGKGDSGEILPADAAEGMEKAHEDPGADAPEKKPEKKMTQNRMGFPNFYTALRNTPGVIKVDGGRLESKKICVFAWFEDKEAAKAWYYGDVHQAMLDRFYPSRVEREPMFLVEDDIPLLIAACYTPPSGPGQGIQQISIELYTPVHAGFSGGGRWGPDEWKDVYEHYDQYEEYQAERERKKEEMGEDYVDPNLKASGWSEDGGGSEDGGSEDGGKDTENSEDPKGPEGR